MMSNGKRTAASIFGGKSHGHPDFKREEKKIRLLNHFRFYAPILINKLCRSCINVDYLSHVLNATSMQRLRPSKIISTV